MIPIFVHQALAGRPLRVFSTGQQRREHMHVGDIVRGLQLGAGPGRPERRGAQLPRQRDGLDTRDCEFITDRLGGTVEHMPGRPGEVLGLMLDSSRAAALGFTPRNPFWHGLADYIEFEKVIAGVS